MSAQRDLDRLRFVAATPALLPPIVAFLSGVKLPTEDIGCDNLRGLEVALDADGRVVGVSGLDIAGGNGLLRSVAVAPDWRKRGLGQRLVARREAAARDAGVSALYLLTNDADGFFRRLGYEDLPRDAVPAPIAAHSQFRSLCPASAKCLGRRL